VRAVWLLAGGTWSHPWCAGPNSAVIRLLLGVQPIEAGWTRFQIAPQPSTLKTINATVPFVLGAAATQVALEMTQMKSSLSMRFSVPSGTTAEVCLPPPHGDSDASLLYQRNQGATASTLTLDGKSVRTVARGRMLCLASDVVAGRHVVVWA
jgi:hypothetical protein